MSVSIIKTTREVEERTITCDLCGKEIAPIDLMISSHEFSPLSRGISKYNKYAIRKLEDGLFSWLKKKDKRNEVKVDFHPECVIEAAMEKYERRKSGE